MYSFPLYREAIATRCWGLKTKSATPQPDALIPPQLRLILPLAEFEIRLFLLMKRASWPFMRMPLALKAHASLAFLRGDRERISHAAPSAIITARC